MQDPVCFIDCCAGSHSTGVAAMMLGCHYVGFDIDPQSEVH